RLFTRMLVVLQKDGHKAPKYLDLQKKISAELMQIRFSARMVEKLCDSVRTEVDNIRQIERKIQDLVVNKGGMPRPEFIKTFPSHETSLRWIDREIAAEHPYSEQLSRYRQAIVEQQQKLLDLQTRVMIPLKDLKEINKQMSTGDHALDRRPSAHDPHPGAHDRDDQQDEPHLAADPAGDGPGTRSADARREDGDAGREDPQDSENQQGADLDGDADRRRRRLAS